MNVQHHNTVQKILHGIGKVILNWIGNICLVHSRGAKAYVTSSVKHKMSEAWRTDQRSLKQHNITTCH